MKCVKHLEMDHKLDHGFVHSYIDFKLHSRLKEHTRTATTKPAAWSSRLQLCICFQNITVFYWSTAAYHLPTTKASWSVMKYDKLSCPCGRNGFAEQKTIFLLGTIRLILSCLFHSALDFFYTSQGPLSHMSRNPGTEKKSLDSSLSFQHTFLSEKRVQFCAAFQLCPTKVSASHQEALWI